MHSYPSISNDAERHSEQLATNSGKHQLKSSIVKRSIVIGGHKTSVSLEDVFWIDLRAIARKFDVSLSDLVAGIEKERAQGNLSSAIRVFVLEHWRNQPQQVAVSVQG